MSDQTNGPRADEELRHLFERRHVLAVGGLGIAGVFVLAACGGGPSGTSDGSGAGAAPASGPTGSGSTGSGSTGGASIIPLAQVPVGGAASATGPDGKPVIVAQPTAGTAVAFSAICTHMGCTVAPAGSQLKCPCHGSVYKASDGTNVSGPAPRPLAKLAVKVIDGQVVPA